MTILLPLFTDAPPAERLPTNVTALTTAATNAGYQLARTTTTTGGHLIRATAADWSFFATWTPQAGWTAFLYRPGWPVEATTYRRLRALLRAQTPAPLARR